MKDDFLRRLKRGMAPREAAAATGVQWAVASKWMEELLDESEEDGLRIALGNAMEVAVETLKELVVNAEDDKTRLGAAKTILDLIAKGRKPKLKTSQETQDEDLWDHAARGGSPNANVVAVPAREVIDPEDGTLSGEELVQAIHTGDHSGNAASSDDILEPGELGASDLFSRDFQLDPDHAAVWRESEDVVRPVLKG